MTSLENTQSLSIAATGVPKLELGNEGQHGALNTLDENTARARILSINR